MPLKTADNNFGTAKWIVSSAYSDGCTHTTIASALTSAASGDTIFIRPGTYTENLTLVAGVNICAYECDAFTPNVTIVGKCSFSSAGTVSISGIRLQTNSDNFLAVTGSAASIVNLYDCYLNMTNATGITFSSSSSSAIIHFQNCNGNMATTGIALFAHSSAGRLNFYYCHITNTGSSVTRSTCSAGLVIYHYSDTTSPVTTSSTGFIGAGFSNFEGINIPAIIHGGSTSSAFRFCTMQGQASASVTVNAQLTMSFCSFYSSTSPCINGSSTLFQTFLEFADNADVTCTVGSKSSMIGTTSINDLTKLTTGSGSPSGSLTAPKGSIYLRTDGSSTSTRAYINTNAGTTWTAITTVA